MDNLKPDQAMKTWHRECKRSTVQMVRQQMSSLQNHLRGYSLAPRPLAGARQSVLHWVQPLEKAFMAS